MFTDISISTDLNSSFNDFLSNANVYLGLGFTLFVLQVSLSYSSYQKYPIYPYPILLSFISLQFLLKSLVSSQVKSTSFDMIKCF